MPMMSRMRELAPAFIVTVGVIFVLFMVLSDSRIMEVFGGGHTNNVGTINGKTIAFQEFSRFVERARENQKAQTGKDIDEDNMEQFRDQVWEAVVSQTLTEQQMEKYGIFVTDKEIQEAILGPNPPEFLKRSFVDSTGKFNREAYLGALRDPRNKQPLIQAEEAIRQQLLSEKLQAYVNAAVCASEGEIKRRFIDQNIKMNADYVFVDLAAFSDSSISVTKDELKSYYNEHPEKFKVESQRKVKYVMFPIAATRTDSSLIVNQMASVVEKIKGDTSSFKSFVDIYSETPYAKDTMDVGTIPPSLASVIGEYKPGDVIGPVGIQGGIGVYKYLGSTEGKETFVKASHILVPDSVQAYKLYGELSKGADFADYARKYSKDPGSGAMGGDLGWFGKGRMVPEFEKACFAGNAGVVQKPVKSQFGYHIIKVTGKSNKKYAFEKITQSIKPSAGTKDQIYRSASDFAYLANKNGFEKELEQGKLTAQESAAFTEDAYAVPGAGYNRSMVKFAFDNSVNTVSHAFKAGNGYVVFKVSAEIKPGVKSFDEVEKEVKPMVIKEKKYEKAKALAEKVKSEVGSDFAKAPQLHAQAKNGTAQQFTTGGSITGVGLDYNFAAEAYKAKLNTVVGPFKGARGYYLISVKDRAGFDQNAYNVQRDGLRDNIINEKKQQMFSQWLQKLKENSKISDKRYMYYGQ